MNEREPNPEQNWFKDNCGNEACGQEYEIKPENSRLDSFKDHPECSYIYTYCPHCENYFMRLFLVESPKEEWIERGFTEFEQDKTPKHVLASFEAIMKAREPEDEPEPEIVVQAPQIDLNEEFRISPRQERKNRNAVGFLIYLAENGRL